MATLLLPVRHDVPYSDFEVELEGRSYTFETRWNERAGAWFLTVKDTAGVVLVAGRKMVLGAGLLGRSPDARLPPGGLLLVDTSGTEIDPGRDDLGERVVLAYYESTGV